VFNHTCSLHTCVCAGSRRRRVRLVAFDGRESVQLLGVSQVPYSGPGLCRTHTNPVSSLVKICTLWFRQKSKNSQFLKFTEINSYLYTVQCVFCFMQRYFKYLFSNLHHKCVTNNLSNNFTILYVRHIIFCLPFLPQRGLIV
jgi:hypothetical protein